jgi:hypothetical protein
MTSSVWLGDYRGDMPGGIGHKTALAKKTIFT